MPMHNDNRLAETHVLEAIRAIKYGAVEVVIHNSRVVQVEKTEKMRFDTDKPQE